MVNYISFSDSCIYNLTISKDPYRAATFRKLVKRLHEFQKPKRFCLHVTSRLIFFIMQLRKIADIFPKNPLKNVPCVNI